MLMLGLPVVAVAALALVPALEPCIVALAVLLLAE